MWTHVQACACLSPLDRRGEAQRPFGNGLNETGKEMFLIQQHSDYYLVHHGQNWRLKVFRWHTSKQPFRRHEKCFQPQWDNLFFNALCFLYNVFSVRPKMLTVPESFFFCFLFVSGVFWFSWDQFTITIFYSQVREGWRLCFWWDIGILFNPW